MLSPSTRDFDAAEKVAERKSVDSIDHILVVEPNSAEAILWSRDPDRAWERSSHEGPDAIIALSSLGISLVLRDVYEGVTFPEVRPVLSLR